MKVTEKQLQTLLANTSQNAPKTHRSHSAGRRGQSAATGLPTEEQEQAWFIAWIDITGHPAAQWTFHPANGGHRHPATAAAMKRMGVRPGVLDLITIWRVGDTPGLIIETKRRDRRNHPTDEQKLWLAHFAAQGWATAVSYNVHEMAAAWLDYLCVDDATRRELLRLLPVEAAL